MDLDCLRHLWGNSANCQGGLIPDGAGAIADISKLDITTAVTVTLDTSRTVGTLYLGDTNSTHSIRFRPKLAPALLSTPPTRRSTLVPTAIPEPATWIGGALALGALGFAFRARKA